MNVVNSLAPVFLVLALGVTLRRSGFLSADIVRGLNRLTYWVGLPSLLFSKIATSRVELSDHGDALAALLMGFAICIALAYLVAWVLRAPRGSTGALVQASFRGNLAFVGLPILIYSSRSKDGAVALAVVLLGIIVPVYSVTGVAVLLLDQRRRGLHPFRRIFAQLATNPLVVACLAGGAVAAGEVPLPLAVDRTLEALGQMALPLALLGVGASLEPEQIRGGHVALIVAASLIKVLLAPLSGYALSGPLGLSLEETRIVCTFLACPAAAVSFVLADQLGGDRALAAGAVALSTLLSLASLAAVVALL